MEPEAKSVLQTILDVVPLRRRIEFGDGFVWIPGLDDRSFDLAERIEEALRNKNHSCGSRNRASHGIKIEVPDATEPSTQDIMDVIWDVKNEEEASWGEYP